MFHKKLLSFSILLLLVVVISGCTSQESAIQESAAMIVVGKVNHDISFLEEDIRLMETIDIQAENSSGTKDTYSGVPILALLELAGIKSDAASVIFSNEEGKSLEISMEDLQNCEDCIFSFRNKGGFSLVVPGIKEGVQVKGVNKAEVK